jgi:hypothetical protein
MPTRAAVKRGGAALRREPPVPKQSSAGGRPGGVGRSSATLWAKKQMGRLQDWPC